MESLEIIRMLMGDGWQQVRYDSLDKHAVLQHPRKGEVMVPHPMTLPYRTAQSILRDAGLP
jgi:predicted RNA binding protein YcfA (HicA-like mRNA interferase family)